MSSRRHGSLTLDNDMMLTLDKLKKWYGHRSRAEVVRFLASKALKEIKGVEGKSKEFSEK